MRLQEYSSHFCFRVRSLRVQGMGLTARISNAQTWMRFFFAHVLVSSSKPSLDNYVRGTPVLNSHKYIPAFHARFNWPKRVVQNRNSYHHVIARTLNLLVLGTEKGIDLCSSPLRSPNDDMIPFSFPFFHSRLKTTSHMSQILSPKS